MNIKQFYILCDTGQTVRLDRADKLPCGWIVRDYSLHALNIPEALLSPCTPDQGFKPIIIIFVNMTQPSTAQYLIGLT